MHAYTVELIVATKKNKAIQSIPPDDHHNFKLVKAAATKQGSQLKEQCLIGEIQ